MGDYKNKYRLDSTPLGRGGMAEVFRATHRETEKTYALKRARPGPGHEKRLSREIDTLLRLAHPHIMPVLDSDEDLSWYCMPIAQGNLHERAPDLFENERLGVIHDVARGIAHAHTHQVVHRDVTPNNIFFISDQERHRWVLGDFGLVSRPAGESTSLLTRGAMGTEWFVAPEMQIDAHIVDHRADIYSFGKTIEWMVTGRRGGIEQGSIPEPWVELIQQMTSVARDARPESIEQVIKALAGIEGSLRAQQRASWGGKVAVQKKGALPEAENLVLQVIAGEDFGSGLNFIRLDNKCHRLKTVGVRLALRFLVDEGLVEEREEYDDEEAYCVYSVTDAGFTWLQQNRNQLDLFLPPNDEDLSF